MKTFQAEIFGRAGCELGECPVWDPDRGAIWFVDLPARKVGRMDAETGAVVTFDMPLVVSAVVRRAGGGLAAATARGFRRIDIVDGRPVLADDGPGPDLPRDWRLNDGACDREGRFWAGSLAPDPAAGDPAGRLHSLEPDGRVVARGGSFRTQNGLAWDMDGRRMYVSDSHPSCPRVTRYAYDGDTGAMTAPSVIADGDTLGGRPDGAALDADGCYWICASDSGRVLRLTPEGRVDAAIELGTPNPTNLCFAGPDLRTVFITTIGRPGPGGGDIHRVDLPIQGYPDTDCAAFGT